MECKGVTEACTIKKADVVLIETLWNVKGGERIRAEMETGFNRNIVECKDEVYGLTRTGCCGFNRNIVECKDFIFEHF